MRQKVYFIAPRRKERFVSIRVAIGEQLSIIAQISVFSDEISYRAFCGGSIKVYPKISKNRKSELKKVLAGRHLSEKGMTLVYYLKYS